MTHPLIKNIRFPNLGYGGALAALFAATGISLWLWVRLLVIGVYGPVAFLSGLRVIKLSRTEPIIFSNGEEASRLAQLVFALTLIIPIFFLMNRFHKLAGVVRPYGLVVAFLWLLAAAAWMTMIPW